MIKKFVAVAAFLAVCLSTAAAADKTDPLYPRHEVTLGLSPITPVALILKIGSEFFNGSMAEEDFAEFATLVSDFHNTGGLLLSYSYRISPVFAIGGSAKFEAGSFELKNGETGDKAKLYFNFSGIYVDVKATWLRKKYFWLYSRADIGIKYDYADSILNTFNFAWQAVPLAAEIGNKQIRVFVELGGGNQGIGTIGLRYRF